MHNHDHVIALAGIALLLAVPILTGIYNDWQRSPKRVNHPSVWCAAHLPGSPYGDPIPCQKPHMADSIYCKGHRS